MPMMLRRNSMSSAELSLSSGWSSATAERIGLQGRRAILQQALGRWVVSAAATADERPARGGGRVRAGAGAVLPPREASSSEPAVASASRLPAGSGTGGSGSPGDADDVALHAAAAGPSPSTGLTAEMALSILVDCFGH